MDRRIKSLHLAKALILITLTGNLHSQCYELIWAEEFNYTGFPNPSVWNWETGNNNGNNNESQYYKQNDQDNCWVDNGSMIITAMKESYGGQDYTSARINTKGKAEFKYGKIEARMKLPYGQGIWPAFWMLGENIDAVGWPQCGEIDIMELIGGTGYNDRTVYGTPHWADASGNHADYGGYKSLATGKFADDFHVFSIEWTSQKIAWFLDGVQFHVMSTTPSALSEFHQEHFIILNLAVGGNWPGYPDATTVFPQKFEIDYVRVYQNLQTEKISGKDSVIALEKSLSFGVTYSEGRSYNWTVPDGVQVQGVTDSSHVLVNWGCAEGELVCQVTTPCSTSYNFRKKVTVAEPFIEGPLFYNKTTGNLFFSVPELSETQYKWEAPEGSLFISGDTTSTAEITWGTLPGSVNLRISNTCNIYELSRMIRAYGQYPYPDPDKPFIIPGTINSTDYDYGGQNTAYYDTDVSNQGTGPREDERVDTEYQSLFPNVGWIQTGEWLEYTIQVPAEGFYRVELKVASQNTTNIGPVRVLVNGEARVPDISVPSTGAWNKFITVAQRLLPLSASDTLLRIEAVKGGFNLGPITLLRDLSVSSGEEFTTKEQVLLYPNPAADRITIRHYIDSPGEVFYKLYDLRGTEVYAFHRLESQTGMVEVTLQNGLEFLPSGFYILEVINGQNCYKTEFLKQHN